MIAGIFQTSVHAANLQRATPITNENLRLPFHSRAARLSVKLRHDSRLSPARYQTLSRKRLIPLQALQLPTPPGDDDTQFDACSSPPVDVDQELWEVGALVVLNQWLLGSAFNDCFEKDPVVPAGGIQ